MITQQNKSSRSIPSLYALKGEATALRETSTKKLSQTGALKAVARKYGFRTWEEMEALSRKKCSDPRADFSVAFLLINDTDQALIVNRTIISTSYMTMGHRSIESIAENLAEVMSATLVRANYSTTEDDGKDWGFVSIATKLSLIDAAPVAPRKIDIDGYKLHMDTAPGQSVKYESPQSMAASNGVQQKGEVYNDFAFALSVASKHMSYTHNSDPYIDFDLLVDSVAHPNPQFGKIDYMLSVTIEKMNKGPFVPYFAFYPSNDHFGRVEKLPPVQYLDKAQKMAQDLLACLVDEGVDIDIELLRNESSKEAFDPSKDM